MSLKQLIRQQIRRSGKPIGFKIALGYSVLFACSFVVLTVFAYLLLKSALVRQDRALIENEVESLQAQYQQGGWTAFYSKVVENDRFRKNNPFFTRVLPAHGRQEYVFFPQYWKDFDLSALEKQDRLPPPGLWMDLPNRTGAYSLEIFTASQPDGTLFQVGISTEDRLSMLLRFKESFLAASIPLVLLAAAGGALLSSRTLRPLRDLIEVVASIEAGKLDARVCVTRSGDELDELGSLFNRMIEKIDQLIQGMRGSLDSVAHDLRTPMTRFRNKAESVLQHDQSREACREALQECLEESERILRMLRMLMDISEAETGTMRLRIREVDLVALAGEIVDMYRFVGEEKGIVIETDLPVRAPLWADEERTSQVVANLLDNAVKFTPAGGRVRLTITNLPGQVHLEVADTGTGIQPGEIQNIWDRLYRGGQAAHKGLGLGLSLVRAVVHAHHGNIQVVSTPGSGSTFSVRLPSGIPALTYKSYNA